MSKLRVLLWKTHCTRMRPRGKLQLRVNEYNITMSYLNQSEDNSEGDLEDER